MQAVEQIATKINPLPSFPARKRSVVGRAQDEEAACQHGIHVFMTAHGYASNEHRRVLLDKETPLRALRAHYGREMSQTRTTDDYGFTFSESDLDQPLWKFSDGCALQVAFVHTHANNAKTVIEQGAQSLLRVYVGTATPTNPPSQRGQHSL
jgi:hypothetical protein